MADEIDESAETFSEDACCPYCDKPLGHRVQSGELLQTCGSHECHHAAISKGIAAAWADRRASGAIALGQYPWRSKDIDFQNGFDSQNLIFTDDYARLRPR